MRRAAPISEPSPEIAGRLQNLLGHAAQRFPDFFARPSPKEVLLIVDRASSLAPALGVPTAPSGAWIGVSPSGELCAALRAAALGPVDDAASVGTSPTRLRELAAELEGPPEPGVLYAVAAVGGGIWRLKARIKSMAIHARPNAPGGTA